MANFHSSSLDVLLRYVLSIIFLVFSTIFINNTYAADDTAPEPSPSPAPATRTNVIHVTEVVDQFCNRTSNYTFCVDILYSDPRTPEANRNSLAYISFYLAYHNAGKTQDRITHLLESSSSSGSRDHENLRRCQRDYKKGIEYLGSALDDLDSDTFFALADHANDAALVAEDCQIHYPPLHSWTLKFLCEICFVISKSYIRSS